MTKKIVLITGASSGFGRITAEFLARNGYQVYATMRQTRTKNAEAATELNSADNISVLDLDVTKEESVNSAVEKVITQEGQIDVLINNAGYTAFGVTESFTEEDFQNILDVNLIGCWRLIRATLPQFRKQADGLIINISSGAGRFSVPFCSMYSATKFGLEGLIEGIHFELKHLGIESILVQPGNFSTGLQSKFVTGSNSEILKEYGEVAQLPNKMAEGMITYFESGQAPNPVLISEQILKLINTEKGKRPFRSVVDPTAMGMAIETANKAVAEQSRVFMESFGL